MEVYILKENFYNYDSGEQPISTIDGVYSSKEKAVEERRKIIVDNVLNFNFIIDEQLKGKDVKNLDLITLFYDYQENWQNYIELEILEQEIQ